VVQHLNMESFIGTIQTKLPETGTSIFAVMSQMAAENQAVNLSQGFPDFPVSEELIERVHHYMKAGFNQYAPMPGVKPLRQAISKMFADKYNVMYLPDTEINITAGATQALYTTISAFIKTMTTTGCCASALPKKRKRFGKPRKFWRGYV